MTAAARTTDPQVEKHVREIVAAVKRPVAIGGTAYPPLNPHRVFDELANEPVGERNVDAWGTDLTAVLSVLRRQGPQSEGISVRAVAKAAGIRGNANGMVYLPYFPAVAPISYLVALNAGRVPAPTYFSVSSYIQQATGDWRVWGISTRRRPDRQGEDELRRFYDVPPPAYVAGRRGSVTLCVVWANTLGDGREVSRIPVDAFWWIPTSNFDPRVWCSQSLEETPEVVLRALQRQARLPDDVPVPYTASKMTSALVSRLKRAVACTDSDDVFASRPWIGLRVLTSDRNADIKRDGLTPQPIDYGDDVETLRAFQDAGYTLLARCALFGLGGTAVSRENYPDESAIPGPLYIDDVPYPRATLASIVFRSPEEDPRAVRGVIWHELPGTPCVRARGTLKSGNEFVEASILALPTTGPAMAWCTLGDVSRDALAALAADFERADASGGAPHGSLDRIQDSLVIRGASNASARETRARWPVLREHLPTDAS